MILTPEWLYYRQVDTCFYETTIKKKTFQLSMADDGPYISCGRGGVQLSRGEVIHLDEDYEDSGKVWRAGPHIAKYGDPSQIRIPLEGFGPAEFRKMEKEFGARAFMKGRHVFDFEAFEKSKAFLSMQTWMAQNPKYAQELRGKHEWYDAALAMMA